MIEPFYLEPSGVIYNADCLDVMPQLADKSIDCIICDLPYGTTACSWDTVIPFEPLWAEYKRLIKDNGAIVLFGSQPFTSKLIISNFEMFKYEIIWVKSRPTGFLDSNKKPLKQHENICIFYKNLPTYNPQDVIYEKTITTRKGKGRSPDTNGKTKPVFESKGSNFPTSILHFGSESLADHPTQKPLELLKYLVLTYSNEGDTILDNCSGSGTTGRACKDLSRKFVMIEQNEEYCKISKNRLAQEVLF